MPSRRESPPAARRAYAFLCGAMVAALRKRARLSQAALIAAAPQADVSKAGLSRFERGKSSASAYVLRELEAALRAPAPLPDLVNHAFATMADAAAVVLRRGPEAPGELWVEALHQLGGDGVAGLAAAAAAALAQASPPEENPRPRRIRVARPA